VNWQAWWDPAHSYSEVPGALRLDARAGGALVERWPGGSVEHARVLAALPPSLLRLAGGFGPLQALPVGAVLEFAITTENDSTRLAMTYRVAGGAGLKLDTLAGPVDSVMSAAFDRLVTYANTGQKP
uniref:ATPase n=1 Tax=Sandarakinorhabdus rubra TaxID=2672568 RepID=UPI0013D96588